jgi:DNA modification methylase
MPMNSTQTVIEGDAVEEMRKMDENSIDAIVCDPPY